MAQSLFFQLISIFICLLFSLSQSAPLAGTETTSLSKRENSLYTLWKSIPATKIAKGDSATRFAVDETTDDVWGITYLYGCTAMMIYDNENVLVAHFQQDSPDPNCLNMNDKAGVDKYIKDTLAPETALFDPIPDRTKIALIYDSCVQNSYGMKAIRAFLTGEEFGIADAQILPQPYGGGGSTGEPDPESFCGLACMQWTAGGSGANYGTMKVYFGNRGEELPIDWNVYAPQDALETCLEKFSAEICAEQLENGTFEETPQEAPEEASEEAPPEEASTEPPAAASGEDLVEEK